jgi:pilus assembly protein CpaC
MPSAAAKPSRRTLYGSALALAALLVAAGSVSASPAPDPAPIPGVTITQAGGSSVTRDLSLPINKSAIIELSIPASEVIISNPQVADAFVQTSQRLIFRGIQTGKTNAFIFDRNGQQILNLEITVEQDISDLQAMISRLVPGARVRAEGINGNVVLTGNASNLSQSDQVLRITRGFLSDPATQIVNLMAVDANDQVMLQVRVVEMQRSVVKQLGISLSGSVNVGEVDIASLGLGSTTSFPIFGGALGGLSLNPAYTTTNGAGRTSTFGAALNALERVGIVRTLAEPTLSAVSGEAANFLAGGEFPVPVGQDEDGRVTIEFKQFGVGLGFTPLVLSEERISLKISTEVSELSNEGAFQGSSVAGVDADGNPVLASTITVPSLKVRRAESTIELPSGGSMMIAGLIQSETRQILDGIPGARDLPVLGALFRSRDFVNDETELVIIVTPYLVDPTQPAMLGTPADGYATASDVETNLFGRLNAIYGAPGREIDQRAYSAPIGFIED